MPRAGPGHGRVRRHGASIDRHAPHRPRNSISSALAASHRTALARPAVMSIGIRDRFAGAGTAEHEEAQ